MGRFAFIAAIACAGCFPPSLGEGRITCGADGACPPGYACRVSENKCYSPGFPVGDGGGAHDLAGTSGADLSGSAGGDMALSGPGMCTMNGQRICINPTHSGTCMENGNSGNFKTVADRPCPTGSMCMGGHCQPPMGAMPCMRDKDCNGGATCIEYVMGNMLAGFCTQPVGKMSTCTATGYDNKCTSGICVAGAGDMALKICWTLCTANGDCGGGSCDVVGAPGQIEGVSTSALRFCSN